MIYVVCAAVTAIATLLGFGLQAVAQGSGNATQKKLKAVFNEESQESIRIQEETLSQVYELIKKNKLEQAESKLQTLAEQFPDTVDYQTLLKMTRKRKDAEGWYRYQDWDDKRPRAKTIYQLQKPVPTVNQNAAQTRLYELKRQTWMILSRGGQID